MLEATCTPLHIVALVKYEPRTWWLEFRLLEDYKISMMLSLPKYFPRFQHHIHIKYGERRKRTNAHALRAYLGGTYLTRVTRIVN